MRRIIICLVMFLFLEIINYYLRQKEWCNIITSCASFISKLLEHLHCKKRVAVFPSPDGMSLTKLPLAWNNLIIPGQGEYGKWHPGWRRENQQPFLTICHVFRRSLKSGPSYTQYRSFFDCKLDTNPVKVNLDCKGYEGRGGKYEKKGTKTSILIKAKSAI